MIIEIDFGNCEKCGKPNSSNGCYDCFPERDPTQPNTILKIKNV